MIKLMRIMKYYMFICIKQIKRTSQNYIFAIEKISTNH